MDGALRTSHVQLDPRAGEHGSKVESRESRESRTRGGEREVQKWMVVRKTEKGMLVAMFRNFQVPWLVWSLGGKPGIAEANSGAALGTIHTFSC